jgi:WD40 repeat protein
MADDVELEHAIGYSGEYSRALWLHPSGQHAFYITGACVVVTELSSHSQTFMRGHDDFVTCLALSPSGRLIASGQRGYNADVIVWDFENGGRILFRFGEHDHEVSVLDFSHDSRLLLSAGNATDGKLFIWDMFTGCIVTSLPLTPRPTLALRFGGFRKDIKGRPIDRYQFCSAGEKVAVVWSLNPFTGELENEALNLGPTVRTFTCAAFSSDERYLYLGTSSGDFLVVLVKNLHVICTQPACSQGVASLHAFSPDQVFVGGGDGSLSLWQISTRALEVNRIQLVGALKSISGGERGLLLGSQQGYHFWVNIANMSSVTISENHTRPVTHVAFPRGVSDKFATSSEDGTIRIWNGSDYGVISRCVAANAGAPLVFVLTLEVVISGWQDGRLRTFRADNGQALWFIDNAHRGGVTAMDLSQNQRFIVTGGHEGEVRVWEVRSKEMVSTLKEHTQRVTQIALLPDDSHVISVSRDKSMLTWSLRSDKRVSAHTQRTGGMHSLSLASASRVLTAGQERKLTMWDLNQTSPLTSADTRDDEYFTIAVSHNQQFVATGGERMKLQVWDLSSMRIIAECTGHSGPISRVAWSYDDRQIVSVGQDNCIFVWNVYLS